MCGDGPLDRLPQEAVDMFPPHVRGWTSIGPSSGSRLSVSPACAGMDPQVEEERVAKAGFPRMCGDGPVPIPKAATHTAFPPHVRGWTYDRHAGAAPSAVSPACAGMDPPGIARGSPPRCFPRMCGDGPVSA